MFTNKNTGLGSLFVCALFLNLTACGGGGSGDTPPADTTPPSVPASLTGSATDTQVSLSWSASTDADNTVASYRVYRDGSSAVLAEVNALSLIDATVSASTTYNYRISAVDSEGNESGLSTTFAITTAATPDTTAPSVPDGLAGTATDTQVSLNWNASTDAQGVVSAYRIYKDGNAIPLAEVTSPAYIDTAVNANTTYNYQVSAVDDVNNESALSTAYMITTMVTPPSATVYYVSSMALNDTGDGTTPATAKQTIQAAIDAATAPAEVRVNDGTYTVDSTTGTDTHIVLKEGVSLYGGYNSDFSIRDLSLYTSTITDTGTGKIPNAAIEDSSSITSATIVDGFTINGSTTAEYSAAINLQQATSPIISNCNINGGAGTSASLGIRVVFASPTIEYNIISGGSGGSPQSYGITALTDSDTIIRYNTITGGTGQQTRGINIGGATSEIHNNFIDGGSATFDSVGINGQTFSTMTIYENEIYGGNASSAALGINNTLDGTAIVFNNIISGGNANSSISVQNGAGGGGTITVRNNTLYAGEGSTEAYGVRNLGSSSLFVLENNILFESNAAISTAIFKSLGSDPYNAIRNNNIFGFDRVFVDNDGGCISNLDGDNDNTTCDLAELESLGTIPNGASGNVEDDPVFADIDGVDNDISTMDDNDWHFSAGSPVSVTTGGLNGVDQTPVWTFNTDMDGVTRPASGSPWSMGAFEP